jgi:hypothetical protein
MDVQDRRILELEAEVLALTNVVGEVCKHLATISTRHDVAVRGGLDGASHTLSLAQGYARITGPSPMFDYALTSVDLHRQMLLAPREGGKSGARAGAGKCAGARTVRTPERAERAEMRACRPCRTRLSASLQAGYAATAAKTSQCKSTEEP